MESSVPFLPTGGEERGGGAGGRLTMETAMSATTRDALTATPTWGGASPWSPSGVALRPAGGTGPVRSAPREGFLRRRLHRRHQGPQVAQDRRGRDRRSCATSSIAARSAPTRAPATAPASWCRCRTSSSGARPPSSASRCPSPAITRSATCSCRTIRNGGRSSWTSTPRRSPQEGLSCSAGARCRTTIPRSANR